jgi:hypothetical protein
MRPIPEWFEYTEAATPEVMQRIAKSVGDLPMSAQVRSAPMLAHWFLLDSLLCEFRRNPATDSDLKPAAVPI